MVSKTLAEPAVAPSTRALECPRIEVPDPRSDTGRRVIDVGRDAVAIRRVVVGVPISISVPSSAYQGVALRLTTLEDGGFRYDVNLLHRDPDLSVPLAEGEDQVAVESQWRDWVGYLGLPALVGRRESGVVQVNIEGVDLQRRLPFPRRRGAMLKMRRPRFLMRRKIGAGGPSTLVSANPDPKQT